MAKANGRREGGGGRGGGGGGGTLLVFEITDFSAIIPPTKQLAFNSRPFVGFYLHQS